MSENTAVRRMVTKAWSANTAIADPDHPEVRGFAEFGLTPSSPLTTQDQLAKLTRWRDSLEIPANSAFLDGTLLQTVYALLTQGGPRVLTPVTLWELTTFIDALVCFDRLYCIDNPDVDLADFNGLLGTEVLSAIPDPDAGTLRGLATTAARNGLVGMRDLWGKVGADDEFGAEVEAIAHGWQAVLGADLPSGSPFDVDALDLARVLYDYPEYTPGPEGDDYDERYPVAVQPSSFLVDGSTASGLSGLSSTLYVLTSATRVPVTPADQMQPPALPERRRLAATATYRTYVNQGIANALAVPYLPGTLRMPFRRMFVRRAAAIQDELVTVALADEIFAKQQPTAPLTLPFFTTAVLRRASTLAGVWDEMARVREQSAPFRRKRAELDAELELSTVSSGALKLQAAIRDEAANLADLATVAQQVASTAFGVAAQTGIVPLAGTINVLLGAAQGVGRDGAWTRVWRRLFNRHEHFLAQTNSQAIGLTNAMPQIERLWELPKIGGYLDRFAKATQQAGHVLKDS